MTVVVGTLWGDARQRQTKVILSVAAINGLELNLPRWSFKDKPAEFQARFSYGKIPAFEGTDGVTLTEGGAIARYLSSVGTTVNLLGSGAGEAATVDQWAHFAEHEIGAVLYNIFFLVHGIYTPFSPELLGRFSERLDRALGHLESHLATRSSGYVALDRLTLADLVVAGTVFVAATLSLGAAERANYPHIFAHYETVTGDERVRQYWGTAEFADVRVTAPRPVWWV